MLTIANDNVELALAASSHVSTRTLGFRLYGSRLMIHTGVKFQAGRVGTMVEGARKTRLNHDLSSDARLRARARVHKRRLHT